MTPATSPARSCKVAPSREPQLLPTPRILIEIVWNPSVTSARARRSKYPVLQPAFASNTTGAPKPQSAHSNVASPTSMLRCCCNLTSDFLLPTGRDFPCRADHVSRDPTLVPKLHKRGRTPP